MTQMNLVAVPNDGRGSPGDGPGMIAIKPSGELFYCFKPYNGTDRIWMSNGIGILQMLVPPAAPVITSCTSTLPPLIQGTLSTPAQTGYNRKVYVRGTLKTASSNIIGVTSFPSGPVTVNGNNWSYQVPPSGMYPYSPGVWEITAISVFEHLNGDIASNQSLPSATLTKQLSEAVPIPQPKPVLTLRVTGPYGGAFKSTDTSATIFWSTTGATTLTVSGPIPTRTLPPTTVVENIKVTKATSGTYTFTATGPGGKTVAIQSVSVTKP